MSLPEVTEYRNLGETERFCVCDLKHDPQRGLVGLADELNKLLESTGVVLQYINIVNADPESKDYNPDGLIGYFRAIQYR